MNKNLTRVIIKPAAYLSEKDVNTAKELSRALYTCKTTSEVISVTKQLNALIRKAATIRDAREHANKLMQMSREELENYFLKIKK